MSKPTLHYDPEKDILYIVLREGPEHHFAEVAEDVIVEFDEHDQPIGIEILNALKLITSTIGREHLAPAVSS